MSWGPAAGVGLFNASLRIGVGVFGLAWVTLSHI